ncbi:CatB-related O-acetyltransferase [Flavobacterium sp.]|uniref:CatB-related O-acetyltransferase n=1 Tax=Flavobacterium sp. TaxID=239 RepID=UPI00260BFC07|nr:CatB-related O-acetyltransferase [Flavobacterium sp.]
MRGTLVSGENVIGEHTYVGFNCVITASSIGRYCSIANNVSVGVGEHKIHRVSTSSLFYARPFQTLTDGKCTIGNDVWLGSNVVVRRGVTIGDGAIVGANSFVNKDVKPFEIVGGIPARTIKMRFTDDKIRMIQESKWWEKNLEEAKVIIAHLEKQGLFETDAQ